MADIQRTVEIIFGAIDNTGEGLSSVSNSLNSFVEGTSTITGPLSDVAKFAGEAELAILALGAAMLSYSVDQAGKMQAATREIGTLFNGTAGQTDAFKNQIQDFAQGSTQSIDSINGAVYSAVSAGVDYRHSLELIAQTEQLSIVGRAGLDDTTRLIVSTMNAYGASTNQAADYSDILFTAIQRGQITLPELNSSLAQVTGTASAAGIPFDTLSAALAGLTVSGLPTSQAITGLKAAISNIINPTTEAQQAATSLGVQFDLSAIKTLGFKGFLDQLNTATGGNIETMGHFFGSTEALNAIMVLASDKSGAFANALDAMAGRTGNVANAFGLMSGNLDLSTQRMINNFQVASQHIGEPLLEQWTDVIGSLGDIFQGLSVSIDAGTFAPVFDAFNTFGVDITATLQQIAQNLPAALAQVDFSGVVNALQAMGIEIGNIFNGLDLTTADGLAGAIQFVVDSFESLTRVVTGVIDAWEPMIQAFVAGIGEFNNLDDASQRTFGNVSGVANVFETLKNTITGGFDALDTIGTALTVIAGGNVVSGIAALGPAMAGVEIAALPLATALTAVAIAVGGVAFGVTENIDAWTEYKARQDTVADSTAHLTETQAGITDRLAEISQHTGIVVNSMAELNQAVDEGRLVFSQATGAYEAAGAGVRDFDAEVAAAAQGGLNFADAVNAVSLGLIGTKTEADNVIGTFNTLAEAEQFFTDNLSGAGNATITYVNGLYQINAGTADATVSTKELAKATNDVEKANQAGTEEWKRIQDVMLDTQKQTDDFTIKLGELANKRYEIDVKANVELKTAEIEADTQRIIAAFQATSQTISDLTQASTDLWGLFAGDVSLSKRFALEDAALRNEQRLDEALALQREQVEAIVDKMRAETARLESGEALISIDAGELAPELELVFDKILKYTQIKATQQGLSLLVGL